MIRTSFLLVFGLALLLYGCTKYSNPGPFLEEYEQESEKTIKPKVLVIAIDGLVGSQLKAYTPPFMTQMLAKGKYSYKTMGDKKSSTPASWATLMSGYNSDTHKIASRSYLPDPDGDHHGALVVSPTLLHRIEDQDSKISTIALMRDEVMTNSLLVDADYSEVLNSDEEIKNKAVEFLTKENPDFFLLQFSEVLDAGTGTGKGFVLNNSAYKDALDRVDSYVREVVTAVESRPDYAYERWLIILTSAHGGTAEGTYGGSSADEMQTFSLLYNKDFSRLEFTGDLMSSLSLGGYFVGSHRIGGKDVTVDHVGIRAQSPNGAASNPYNVNSLGGFTLEYKLKLRPLNPYTSNGQNSQNWIYLMGKDASIAGNTRGWHLRQMGTDFDLIIQPASAGLSERAIRFTNPSALTDRWNNYAIVFNPITNNTRTETIVYVDGVEVKRDTAAFSPTAFSNTEPFTLGYNTNDPSGMNGVPNYDISSVRLWNKTLSGTEISTMSCLVQVPVTFSSYESLVGEFAQLSEATWINTSKSANKGPDLLISGTPSIRFTPYYSPCAVAEGRISYQTVDIVPQILYWLGINASESWKLEGSLFLNQFQNEFLK